VRKLEEEEEEEKKSKRNDQMKNRRLLPRPTGFRIPLTLKPSTHPLCFQAKEHVRRLEAEAHEGGGEREEDSDADLQEEETPRDAWDCESVLTSRTSLYNHPTRLGQEPRRR
jgi:hypothetical protein